MCISLWLNVSNYVQTKENSQGNCLFQLVASLYLQDGQSLNETKLNRHKTWPRLWARLDCHNQTLLFSGMFTCSSFVSICIICASIYLPPATVLLYCLLESNGTRVCDTPVLSFSPSPLCDITFMKSCTLPPSSSQQNLNTQQWRS